MTSIDLPYRGRLAPSPTGLLHLGHGRTFWIAYERASDAQGVLVLRNEDLDRQRTKPEFEQSMLEDLHWLGIRWQEGPDVGGPHAPYQQSERMALYRAAFEKLRDGGFLFPCACSRKDIEHAARAPHAEDDEPIYPRTCRDKPCREGTAKLSWRFRVPDGEQISFIDRGAGSQCFVAGRDFGDFIVWRHDGVPSYQLAVTVDDAAMGITEVVRGADLLVSTARQILLYRALNLSPPAFFHCALVLDDSGRRLAKRSGGFNLQALREAGVDPAVFRDGKRFAALTAERFGKQSGG